MMDIDRSSPDKIKGSPKKTRIATAEEKDAIREPMLA